MNNELKAARKLLITVGQYSLFALAVSLPFSGSAAVALSTEANVPIEITLTAQRAAIDPFNDISVHITFVDPKGVARKVPGFWAGGDKWKVRYASPLPGAHRWISECNPANDSGLHGLEGVVAIKPYTGANALFRHGPLRASPDKRHLEHSDGTPFFWLGDTWWMGLCHRLQWPTEFQQLAADRKAKGFNVIQIVAGLYPDMHPFDPRGANEAGYPWETNYARIRPEYFDAADKRLRYLMDEGFTPCIVGAWGYFIPWMGVEKMNKHWRYLIARYGAWPVVWCAGGEANLPWYLARGFPYDDRKQVRDWTEVMRFIRKTDPFQRLLTIHPTGIGRLSARNATEDSLLLDIDMLQTPHGQREAVSPTVRTMRESYGDKPVMPVINGEASYEMLMDKIPAEWPRAMFWVCMMNGAAGHTYGANGIWQLNRRGKPHGPSPNGTGNGYGVITWEQAMHLEGSRQVSDGKRFLESLPWTEFKPMPESVAWADSTENSLGDWIWFPEGDPRRDAPVEARYFRRSFDLPEKRIQRATVRIAADDRFTAWLNGKKVASGSDWNHPVKVDVSSSLKAGRNVLAFEAENSKAPVVLNPAGLTAALEIEFPDQLKIIIKTDGTWRSAKEKMADWFNPAFDDTAWPTALVTAKFGQPPWGRIGIEDPLLAPQACGIGDRLRVVYALDPRPLVIKSLAPNAKYRATHFDPVTGKRNALEELTASNAGGMKLDSPAKDHDWVLLLERL